MNFFNIIIFILAVSNLGHASDFKLLFETGAVWQHRNDVKIPPGTGNLVEFDEFNQGPFFHYRAEAYYNMNKKHIIRAVYAPFEVKVTGRLPNDVNFNGKSYDTSSDLTVRYKFNSYRLSYIYQLHNYGDTQINIGATLKVRDAKITFQQLSTISTYDNIGFVPLLYGSILHDITDNWYLFSDVDFAVAPQGRAIDLNIKLRRHITKASSFGIGLRSLEGGADNNKVYTFSWFNYLLLDYQLRL